jgi:hypothetical protein
MPWEVSNGLVIAAGGVGGLGVRVKNRRLFRVKAGLYGGGYVVVVNWKLACQFSFSFD